MGDASNDSVIRTTVLSEMARFREYVNLHYPPGTAERVSSITIRYQRWRLDGGKHGD